MQKIITAMFLLLAANGRAARLSPSAERAYEVYVANLEARLARQHGKPETYLAMLSEAGDRNLRVEAVNGGTWQVPGALLHHWRASAFVPDAAPQDMLAVLRDFSHFSMRYAPEVVSAHALKENGETATLAVRFRERRVLTIVLDGEYKIESRLSGRTEGTAFRAVHTFGKSTIPEPRTSSVAPKARTMGSYGTSIRTGASPR